LRFDLLLLIRRKRPSALSLRAHALDRIHHVLLLREESVTEIRRPLDVVCQTLNCVW
jgi:hypothetical protein